MASALINYGFNNLNIHKIFAETVDYEKSVSLMRKLGMKEEGVFRKHTILDGNWCDLYFYSIINKNEGN